MGFLTSEQPDKSMLNETLRTLLGAKQLDTTCNLVSYA